MLLLQQLQVFSENISALIKQFNMSVYQNSVSWECLELDASSNQEPVQGDKERCDMGPFGFVEEQSCRCIVNHL